MCDMPHSYLRHDSFICMPWLLHITTGVQGGSQKSRGFAQFHSQVFLWLIYMCDMTHSYVWHDSFILLQECKAAVKSVEGLRNFYSPVFLSLDSDTGKVVRGLAGIPEKLDGKPVCVGVVCGCVHAYVRACVRVGGWVCVCAFGSSRIFLRNLMASQCVCGLGECVCCVCVCVCVCVHMCCVRVHVLCVCSCACACVCMYVCVRERESERVCMCVCARARVLTCEREREVDEWGGAWGACSGPACVFCFKAGISAQTPLAPGQEIAPFLWCYGYISPALMHIHKYTDTHA